jgi:hypothetical protein
MTSGVHGGVASIRWYRSRSECLSLVLALAVGPGLLGALLLTDGISLSNAPLATLGAASVAVCLWFAVGFVRAGIGVSAQGVVLRSPIGLRRRVPWSHVVSIQVHRAKSRGCLVGVQTDDGRLLHTFACGFSTTARGLARAKAVAHDLDAARQEHAVEVDSSAPWPDLPRITLTERYMRRGGRIGAVAVTVGFLVASAVFGLWLAISNATQLGPALRASHGQGIHGTFVATTQVCGKGGCSWTGNFVLPDGRVTVRDVPFNGGTSNLQAGQTLPALNSGATSMVFPVGDHSTWVTQLVELVFGALWFAGTATAFGFEVRRLLRHRHARTPLLGAARAT